MLCGAQDGLGAAASSADAAQNIGQQNPHKTRGLWLSSFGCFYLLAKDAPIQNLSQTAQGQLASSSQQLQGQWNLSPAAIVSTYI